MLQYFLKAWLSYKKNSGLSRGFVKKLTFSRESATKERAEALSLRIVYFFMEALTMASTSSGVSMGDAISFLGHTAAHRPQEVQRL